MFDKPDYCKKIEGQMLAMRYSSQKLSDKSGYSISTIHKVVTGGNTSVKTLTEILQVLGLELTVRPIK